MLFQTKLMFRRVIASLRSPQKRQVAALCWREGVKGVEVLLITTRRTRRWTPPKGNIDTGVTPKDAALAEAWEEGGVNGVVTGDPVGRYDYLKLRKKFRWTKIAVDLYPVRVDQMADDFPEKDERAALWVTPTEAAGLVNERSLKRVLADLKLPKAAKARRTPSPKAALKPAVSRA